MSRALRIEYENAFYHVMNRGRGRENTFLSDDDFKYFLYCIEQASLRFNIEVHSYCLMTNHYHLLIKTPDKPKGSNLDFIHQWSRFIVYCSLSLLLCLDHCE